MVKKQLFSQNHGGFLHFLADFFKKIFLGSFWNSLVPKPIFLKLGPICDHLRSFQYLEKSDFQKNMDFGRFWAKWAYFPEKVKLATSFSKFFEIYIPLVFWGHNSLKKANTGMDNI